MVIKLISEGKSNFSGCKGPFTIGDDLSAIADIKEISLRSLGNRLQGEYEALTAETITNLNPLTPPPILPLFRPAGTLDALASCTSLTSVNVSETKLEGSLEPLAKCTALVTLNLRFCEKLTGPCPRPAASSTNWKR